MSTSYNGWPASRDPAAINIVPFEVAGRGFPGGVRSGAVHAVLTYCMAQYHVYVESLYLGDVDKDDWGYSFRPNTNNPSELSCHASGTAVDANATHHPNGRANTLTAAQVKEVLRIEKEVGVVRWGGHFTTRDEMHWEIHGGGAAVTAAAKRLKNPAWFHRTLTLGMTGDDVKMVQRRLRITVTGKYDARTADAVRRFRARLHLSAGTSVTKNLAFYIGSPAA